MRLFKKLSGQGVSAYLMCFPALLILFVFLIVPFFMSIFYSFTDHHMLLSVKNGTNFIGLDNYVRVLTSKDTYTAYINTFLYLLYVVPALTVIPFLLAVALNRKRKLTNLFRILFFSPQVISMTVISVVWAFILGSSETSIINTILGFFNIEPQMWLKNPSQALGVIAFMSIWAGVGFNMIIYLSGLQYISPELYEAAEIDGASSSQKVLLITMPLMKRSFVFIFMTSTIAALKIFTQVFILTRGGPINSTLTIVYLIFNIGRENMQVGLSSAHSVIFFFVVLALSQLQSKWLLKEDYA